MIRYNAAHPGAEQDIFPYLAKRRLAIVTYTATRWAVCSSDQRVGMDP